MISPDKTIPQYLSHLNERQLEGALHYEGPILILAGAGSGKTRVLTHRIAHLITHHQVRAQEILAVTFTNKASQEMKARLATLLGPTAEEVWASTFHSCCLRILRRHARLLQFSNDFTVLDQQDTLSILKEIIKELKLDDSKYPAAMFRKAIDQAKNSFQTPEKFAELATGYIDEMVAEVYDRYQRRLLSQDSMDFGDLLVYTVKLFEENREILKHYQRQLRFLLVDEFQDTNAVQYLLIRLLAAPQNNLFVVGDDDQSIYAFRGATIKNILNFENDFPDSKVVKLEQNYRSTETILDSANRVIEKNPDRKGKVLWTEQTGGDKLHTFVAFDEGEEADLVAKEIQSLIKNGRPLDEIAIFYRTNAQSRALEEALLDRSIPYRIYGGLKFYDRKEIKDVLAYLRITVNHRDNQALLRCVNTPPRGIGARAVKAMVDTAIEKSCSLFEAAEMLSEQSKPIRAFVELIHRFRILAEEIPLFDLLNKVMRESGYREKLEQSNDPTAQSRIENLQELEGIAFSMSHVKESLGEDLRNFLDRVSLTSSEEIPGQEGQNEPPQAISLMTLHLAKGLEFPVVFFTGLEEGLLPHHRSTDDPFGVSEERRLCYVGMTRAMERLYLSRAERRSMFSAGSSFGFAAGLREPSRFVFDIPSECFLDQQCRFASSPNEYSGEDQEEDQFFVEPFDQAFSSFRSAQKKKTKTPFNPSQFVKTADSLGKEKAVDSSVFLALPDASIESLTEGSRVIHQSFGAGTVQAVEGDVTKEPLKAKVSILFDDFKVPKKLIFQHAKLKLEEPGTSLMLQ